MNIKDFNNRLFWNYVNGNIVLMGSLYQNKLNSDCEISSLGLVLVLNKSHDYVLVWEWMSLDLETDGL